MKHKIYNYIIIIILTFLIQIDLSCKKNWLDAKSDRSLVTPSSIKDYQELLDNTDIFNSRQPALGEIGSADFYAVYNTWQSFATEDKNGMIWAKDIYQGASSIDWNQPYQQMFYSNVTLEGIDKLIPDVSNQSSWNNLKGSALFYRAFACYNLAQEFCKCFDKTTASADLGIPLRLNANINELSVRSSIQQTYDQITNDLKQSLLFLPLVPLYKTRPSKPAGFALLARTYLAMENYNQAFVYADSCLRLYNTLLDYNSLSQTVANPLPKLDNVETIFYSQLTSRLPFLPPRLIVDSTLYKLYSTNDLRRYLFFYLSGAVETYKGSYTKSRTLFGGLATDEIYLIRAECNARKSDIGEAMLDLNSLLVNRWKTGTFVPFTAVDADDALSQILKERRKELVFRTLRWTDLRRLNKDPRFAVTLTRLLNGTTYILPPNDPKYVLPIPADEILASDIQQNPR